jgi:protein TonB
MLRLVKAVLTASLLRISINENSYQAKSQSMEHRAFHYGSLGIIGAAHLGLLMMTPSHSSPLTPPQVLPVIEMVSVAQQQATPRPAPPTPQTPPVKRPPLAKPMPTPPVQVSKSTVAPPANAISTPVVPTPTQPVAEPPAPAARAVADTRPAPPVEKPAAEQAYIAPTPISGAQGNPKPEYPPLSVELEEEGTVVLRVLVSTKGRALSVAIAKSSGYARLDNSARRTVASRWQFTPGQRGGEAVEEYCLVPVEFTHPHKNKS